MTTRPDVQAFAPTKLHGILDDGEPLTHRPGEYMGISREVAPPPATTPTLDPLQQQAITHARDHLFTNISGTAGVGKTYVAREIIAQADEGSVILAATTGIAAVNLGEGTTINAALKYFDTASLQTAYTAGYLQQQVRKLRRSGVRRILIDEKSMMNGDQLTYIVRAVREVNSGEIASLETVGAGDDDFIAERAAADRDLPPIGITLVGDFGQLPPVPDTDEKTGKKLPVKFAFDSPEWGVFAEHTTTLSKIYRQDAEDFIRALHAVRKGDVRGALEFFTVDRFTSTMDDQFEGTTIFAKNNEVDRYNLLRLDSVTGTKLSFPATRLGKQRGDWKQIPDELILKEGALVMILANRRTPRDEDGNEGEIVYANGDLGTLMGRGQSGLWTVRLQRNNRDVQIYPVTRENVIPLEPGRRKELKEQGVDVTTKITEQGKGKSEIVGTITYMPLRAAYGCTVHKTQGLTLDNVQIKIGDPFFQHPGMLFVALSRARTAEGLRVIGGQKGFIERIKIEPRVQPWL